MSSDDAAAAKPPPTVAVIGCGPSGMFFLHALAHRRARLAAEGDAAGLAALPVVTCFERSSGPGGVWRSDRFEGERDGKSTNMYEALWTNGPKEAMEFFDYTYLEHFGRAMPTFLPRGLVLEYILARCTRKNPNFFDEVKFNTSVDSVEYDDESKKFVLETSDGSAASFDFCVWAAGDNGKPFVPKSISKVLKKGGYKGVTMHSAQTDENFDAHVRDKKVLIVGDESSAEDLALMAIKLGVASIEIVTRSAEGPASDTSSWPMDKVEVRENYLPTGVTEDGRGIVCSKVEYNFKKEKYVPVKGSEVTLDDVDTFIFATGYKRNFGMLDEDLQLDMEACFMDGEIEDGEVPLEDWKMSENSMTKDLGDVPACEEILPDPAFVRPEMYRGRLIANPSLFFMMEEHDVPLFHLDIMAWLILAQVTGDLPLPPREEMHRFNAKDLFECMNVPSWRYGSDDNYCQKWRETIPLDHWSEDYMSAGVQELNRAHWELAYRILAGDARDAGYPLDLGTRDALSDTGRALVAMGISNDCCRVEMDQTSPDAAWRTFRDVDPSAYVSVMTGTGAAPLKGRWLEIEGYEVDDIVEEGAEISAPREEGAAAEEKKEADDKIATTEAPGTPPRVSAAKEKQESDGKIATAEAPDSPHSVLSVEA